MKPSLVAVGAFVLASCAVTGAATTEVLVRAGDLGSDGVALQGFQDPVGTGAVAFQGTTSALMTRSGDAFTVLLRTGDALPLPLAGTFAGFSNAIINDAGAIAFHATGAGTTALDGLFLYDGGYTVPITSQLTGALRGLDLSNTGHVAFVDDGGLWFWTGPSTAPTSIVALDGPAPGGGTFTAVATPVVNAADTLAFTATVSDGRTGVFAWHPATDVVLIAQGSYSRVAINASGQIAFANRQQVGRFDPTDASTTIIASVSGRDLRAIIAEYVGIDSAGNVAFEARARGTGGTRVFRAVGTTLAFLSGRLANADRDFAPRLTDAGQVVWRRARRIFMAGGTSATVLSPNDVTPFGRDLGGSAPSLNASGVVAFVATRGALYRVDGSTPRAVAQAGDLLPSGETITSTDGYAASESSIAFLAETTADRTVLMVADDDGSLRQVAATGDVAPPRGRFALGSGTAFVLRGRTALFTTSVTSKRGSRSGLFAVAPGGKPRLLLPAGNREAGRFRFESISGVDAIGRDVVLVADPRHGPQGLFLATGSGTTRIVVSGQAAPGTDRRFDTADDFVETFAAHRGRVLFVAHLDDAERTLGVFRWRNGRREKLLLAGEALPGGGTADSFRAVAVGDDAEAFVAADRSEPTREAIYLFFRNGLLTRLVGTGDPSPLGGTITSLDPSGSIAFRGNSIVYAATLSGASAPAALLATSP